MNDSGVEAWQISILVTAAIVLVEMTLNLLLRHRMVPGLSPRVRIVGLILLLVLSVVVFVLAIGPTLADQLSSVAAAVAAVGALWLTYRSYQALRDASPAARREPPRQPAPPPEPERQPEPEPEPERQSAGNAAPHADHRTES